MFYLYYFQYILVFFCSIFLNIFKVIHATRKLWQLSGRIDFNPLTQDIRKKSPSLDHSIRCCVFAVVKTYTYSTEHGIKSGSKAFPLCHFCALLFHRSVSLILVSDSVQSCDAKSEFSFQYSKRYIKMKKKEWHTQVEL